MFKLRPLAIGVYISLLTSTSTVSAEAAKMQLSGNEGGLQWDYLGDSARIGVGINNEGDLNGEFLYRFAGDDTSSWLGEGWIGSGGAGGLKLDHHWLNGTTDTVYKAFAAIDQNAQKDRKLSLGGGFEKENYFVDAYVSRALTDKRLVGSSNQSVQAVMSGSNAVGTYQQIETTTTTTTRYEKPYDHGVGLKLGHYHEQHLFRTRLGVDYEWGDYHSDQLTFSLGLEKFIVGTGHSIGLNLEALRRDGDYVTDDNDVRGRLTWRYAFGKTYRHHQTPVQHTEHTARNTQVNEVTPRYRIVKNKVDLTSDTYFDKDSAQLRDDSLSDLKRVADAINSKELIGNISIVGHTCNLGPEDYNMTLSQRRANAVRDQLIKYGVGKESLLTEGRGESHPRYSNKTEDSRRKNRRVDIHFLVVEEKQEAIPATPEIKNVEWEQETVSLPSAWISRALLNPVAHKRQVDVYQFERVNITSQIGDKSYTNRFPKAADDQVQVQRNGGAVLIDVLANDTEPDNETMTITAVTQSTGGTVENFGNLVSFTPMAGFSGQTEFTYTMKDAQGAESQAKVVVNVINDAPVAAADEVFTTMGVAVIIDVLANDSDPNGDTLELVSVTAPGQGTTTIENGRINYQPDAGYSGTDTFSYSIRDVDGAISSAMVTVNVSAAPNSPPVARDDHIVTPSVNTMTINVLANDYDPDGDALEVVNLDNLPSPDIATYAINADGSITMTPTGWDGLTLLTIQYTISDGRGGEATAKLSIIDP